MTMLSNAIDNHTRLEVVGLNYKDNGRSCEMHPNGCGKALRVGEIVHLKCKETYFEEEHLKITKKQEYQSLTVLELKEILTTEYQLKGISAKNKAWLVEKVLSLRNEPNNDEDLTEIKRWSEFAVEVYRKDEENRDNVCKVGYISRNMVSLYPGLTLNNQHGRVLRLRSKSEFNAERAESIRMGGSALIETVMLDYR